MRGFRIRDAEVLQVPAKDPTRRSCVRSPQETAEAIEFRLARACDDPKDRALVLERYSQLKEDPIHIIVLDVQRVKRRAERATGLANGKCYEIRCGDFEEMTQELADGSAEGEDDFAKDAQPCRRCRPLPWTRARDSHESSDDP